MEEPRAVDNRQANHSNSSSSRKVLLPHPPQMVTTWRTLQWSKLWLKSLLILRGLVFRVAVPASLISSSSSRIMRLQRQTLHSRCSLQKQIRSIVAIAKSQFIIIRPLLWILQTNKNSTNNSSINSAHSKRTTSIIQAQFWLPKPRAAEVMLLQLNLRP